MRKIVISVNQKIYISIIEIQCHRTVIGLSVLARQSHSTTARRFVDLARIALTPLIRRCQSDSEYIDRSCLF